jgi:hypothetical protein
MKKQEFQLLVKSGAVAAADLVKRGDLWTVWVGVGPNRQDASGEPIRGRSGEVRTWADMVRAYEFIRAAGFVGKVEVDEAPAVTVTKTAAGQWRWALIGPDGVEIAGGAGYADPDEALADGQAELAAQTGPSAVVV